MREYSFEITEAIKRGLRTTSQEPVNTAALEVMKNLKPTPFGAVSVEVVSCYDSMEVSSWPFPQLFCGKAHDLLVYETEIWSVDVNTGNKTQIATLDWTDRSTPKAIPAGGIWQFIDMYNTWILLNGECAVLMTPLSTSAYVCDSIHVGAGCVHGDGRVVFADFEEANILSMWGDLLDNWYAKAESGIPNSVKELVASASGLDKNAAWWSTIGGGDVFGFFSSQFMKYGSFTQTSGTGYGEERPFIFDIVELNQSGYAPMPWKGRVLRCEAMGGRVALLGEDGGSWLISTPDGSYGIKPISGIGKGIGVCGRGASCTNGDEDQPVCVFVGTDGNLWRINANFQAQKLGFEEFISPIANANAIVSYDSKLGEFWISNDSVAYVLTQAGLGGPVSCVPTSLVRYGNELIGPREEKDDFNDFEIVSCELDMNEAGLKHVTEIEFGMRNCFSCKGSIHYQYENMKSFRERPGKSLNTRNTFFPGVSAKNFKVAISGKSYGEARIDRVEVRFQSDDKSHRRGTKGIPQGGAE